MTQDPNLHLAKWQDRLQDALDGTLDANDQAELQAHLTTCEWCRAHQLKLATLDERLKTVFTAAPALSADFSTRVFAAIDAREQALRIAAKQRAEQEFRARIAALKFDWRAVGQRHFGNIVAGLTVIVTLVAALSSLSEPLRERLFSALDTLPVLPAAMAPSIIVAVFSASAAVLALWWLQNKAQ